MRLFGFHYVDRFATYKEKETEKREKALLLKGIFPKSIIPMHRKSKLNKLIEFKSYL